MSEDIYDLGFETIQLEISKERKEHFFMTGVRNNVVEDTIKYLLRKYQALKAIVSLTSSPEKLAEIHNSGLRIVRVDYVQVWYEEPNMSPFFLHYIIFKDQEELNFFKLSYK